MSVIQKLHDCEINASISSFWDRCWTVKIGDEMNGFQAETMVDSFAEAEEWLDATARRLFPDSDYAQTTRAPTT